MRLIAKVFELNPLECTKYHSPIIPHLHALHRRGSNIREDVTSKRTLPDLEGHHHHFSVLPSVSWGYSVSPLIFSSGWIKTSQSESEYASRQSSPGTAVRTRYSIKSAPPSRAGETLRWPFPAIWDAGPAKDYRHSIRLQIRRDRTRACRRVRRPRL